MEPIERETARVIPVSPAGRVLLLRGHDPAAPQWPYWFTIGGQIEPLESARQAAVRELREEVGIVVPAVALVGPIYRGEHSYSFAGVRYRSRSTFFTVRLDEVEVRPVGLAGEVIDAAAWWDVADLGRAQVSNRLVPQIAALAVAAW